MSDQRELTFGMDFGLDDSIQQLGDVIGSLDRIKDRAEDVENQGREMGRQIEVGTSAATAGAKKATNSLDDLGDKANGVGTDFRSMGREADGFGSAIVKSMGTAAKETQSISKAIKAGFEGAFGQAEKKIGTFTKKVKGIGTAFMHPVKTIKGKLIRSLGDAADSLDDLEDEAEDARKALDAMGNEGDSAGSQIKEAIKGALTAFIGFEAIQAGIDMLKELGAAAVETAGLAENSGRKFEASFAGTDAAEWVDNYADAIHRSEQEVQSFMVSNKAMYGELGITGDAAVELSKISTSLAYDLGNAFAMDDTEALGVIQDYISGNNAALEEYGVHIDEVTLKNTALAMGLGSQIDELDDAAMAQVRMNALLSESVGFQQAAANSTGGLVNSTKDLKGIWSNFMADAGAKFTPVLESLFGAIMDNWPTIEPMLMQFVEILSTGMAQAAPVLIELGQTLIPTLTSVIGTLFQAGLPLIEVFGQLAQTVLPPLASIIGTIAGSIMPPLVDILGTLNTSIIQPLMPLIQQLAESFLPPIAQLLGAISPILDAISPVLSVIGDVLGVIAETLGTVVGWLAGGIDNVVGFFSGIFGGAKDSVDAVSSSSDQMAAATDASFSSMGTSASSTYSTMQDDAGAAWSTMQADAEAGADSIVYQFGRITRAANEASTAATMNVGVSIPHHARGTDNFAGGLTYMNEEGGELALLPGGTAIIPADQTDRLMQSFSSSTTNQGSKQINISPNIEITVTGGDSSTALNIKEQLRALFSELYQEAQDQDYSNRIMQHGYA